MSAFYSGTTHSHHLGNETLHRENNELSIFTKSQYALKISHLTRSASCSETGKIEENPMLIIYGLDQPKIQETTKFVDLLSPLFHRKIHLHSAKHPIGDNK